MTVAMTRSEARRTAWGLIILNLRMKADGPDAVTDEDLQAIAASLTTPVDWGLVTGCLAEIAAGGWAEVHGSPRAALEEALEMALELAAGDDS